MKNVLLLLALIFLFSCKKDNTKELSEQINQWMGRQIGYPADMAFMKLAKDTVEYPFVKSDYKVLVYVDSSGCTSCKLQLRRWKDFSGFNYIQNSNEIKLSDLALANVEALAGNDVNPDCINGCVDGPGGCKCNGYYPQYAEFSKWK